MNPEPTKTSETPETDEFYSGLNTDLTCDQERDEILRFARSLETRLTAANREIARLNELVSDGVGMCESKLEDELIQLRQQNHELSQIASNNSDWFDMLVKDLAAKLDCEGEPTAIFDKVDALKQQMAGMVATLVALNSQLECPARNTTISTRRDGSVIVSLDVRAMVKMLVENNQSLLADYKLMERKANALDYLLTRPSEVCSYATLEAIESAINEQKEVK